MARTADGLVSIAVEGKVAEAFGPTVKEWRADASSRKAERLEFLVGKLGLTGLVTDPIRYQLLHRSASAIIEAERFGARHAVMLVHSFSREHERFDDYAAFAGLFGATATVGDVVSAGRHGSVQLHLGWACCDRG